MTTIVTRAYKDLDTAKSVVEALRAERFPDRDIDLFKKGDGKLAEKLAAAKVPAKAVPAFVKAVEGGQPVVVARAEITPFGAAAKAKAVLSSYNPVAVEGSDGDFYVGTVNVNSPAANLDTAHALQLTRPGAIAEMRNWKFSDRMGWALKSDRRPSEHLLYKGRKLFTEGFGLLSTRRPPKAAVYSGRKLFTEGFYEILSNRKPADNVIMKDHPFMSQRFWKGPLLSERRP